MNQKKAGVLLTYFSELVKILTGLVYTPIMLRLLGQSEYGLYQLVFSVVSYLNLLSLGFASSYIRFYSRKKADNDEIGIAQLNGMFMSIFLVISLVCIVCGIVMVSNITVMFGNGLSAKEYSIAKVLMILMIVGLAITFPNSVFDCNLVAHEEFIFQKSLSLAQSILNPFFALPLLVLGKGSVGIVGVSTFLTMVCFCVNCFYSLKKLKMRFIFNGFQLSLLKEMWIFTFFIFISQIIDQVNWNVDKLLLGRYLGTAAVAVYGVGGQINSMYLQFSTAISNVFIPTVNRIVAQDNDNNKLTDVFTKVGRIQFFIMALILSGFIFIGKTFIKLWAGPAYVESYYVTLLLIIPVTIPLIQNLGIEIQRAKNMHKSRSLVYLCISIGNILISVPLIKSFGPAGAAAGTAVALILGNIIFINWYYHNKIKLNMVFFWKNIMSALLSVIIPCIIGTIIVNIYHIETAVEMIFFGCIYAGIYIISVWRFGLNDYEKDLIKGLMKRIAR